MHRSDSHAHEATPTSIPATAPCLRPPLFHSGGRPPGASRESLQPPPNVLRAQSSAQSVHALLPRRALQTISRLWPSFIRSRHEAGRFCSCSCVPRSISARRNPRRCLSTSSKKSAKLRTSRPSISLRARCIEVQQHGGNLSNVSSTYLRFRSLCVSDRVGPLSQSENAALAGQKSS